MPRRFEYDRKVSLGTIITVGTILVTGAGAVYDHRGRQNSLTEDVQEIQIELSSEMQKVRSTLSASVSRLEQRLEDDLEEVSDVVDGVDTKVDAVIAEQREAAMRLKMVEGEQDDLEDRLGDTRSIALTVQSNANRDRAVQAERHETIINAIDGLNRTFRAP